MTWEIALPVVFAGLMGLSILIYVVLDGFDLGVGVLSPLASEPERDVMVGSIGPFWDANETWLVLAVGLLLVAFPAAHGQILTALYVPATFMLIGLILRGVAFEFRAKGPKAQKPHWDRVFFAGSLLASLTQGYMLGVYLLGLDQSLGGVLFGLLTGLCLTAGYVLIGALWLVAKTEGGLRISAIRWARAGLLGAALGLGAVSLASPLASARIFHKWFDWPEVALLALAPVATAALLWALYRSLRAAARDETVTWAPFAAGVGLFVVGFLGLAYSFFPYVVPEQVTIWQAASATESLVIILIGTLVTLPAILAYSAYVFWVFAGKATALRYE